MGRLALFFGVPQSRGVHMKGQPLVSMRDSEAFLTLKWYARNAKDNHIYAFSDDGLLVSQWRFQYTGYPTRDRAIENMEYHIKKGEYPLCPFSRAEYGISVDS